MRLLTIGGYGYDEKGFLKALVAAEVDTFIDIRQRRGLRGSRYAFLNSSKLQAALDLAGIRYVYCRELAPTRAIRELQKQCDADEGMSKRTRQILAPDFTRAYTTEILDAFPVSLFESVVRESKVAVLFCVEESPEACHRSLAAAFLAPVLRATIEHLRP